MEKRIKFISKNVRNLFFEKSLRSNSIKKWKDLTVKYKISRKSLAKYRNGQLTLPMLIYNNLSSEMEEKDLNYFSKNILKMEENWGQIEGGKITYSRYKDVFERGRQKGLKKIRGNVYPKFNINMAIDEKLAHFVGLFIGDGFSNKYEGYYLTQFVGHVDESTFYQECISTVSKELFNLIPKIKRYPPRNFIRVNFYSKDLFLLLTQRFKIKSGRKSDVVLIPEEIISSPKMALSCIAGIFDAEGCVFFDKRKAYKKAYPRFDLHMHNLPLIKQISSVLKSEGIGHYPYLNKRRIIIYGKEPIEKFLSKVQIKNPKHINKFKREFDQDWIKKFASQEL